MRHELCWIELSECLGARSPLFRPLLDAFGTPEAILAASADEIREVLPGIGAGTLSAITRHRHLPRAKEIVYYCHSTGVRVYPYDHDSYPAVFRELSDPPVLIYCKGTLPNMERCARVGVVGVREADAYGESVAYKLSFEMAAAGAVIVSGMADGIDGIATAGAIAAGGRVISVLGCGIDLTYPAHHTKLRAESIENGAVITEYAPGTPPNGYNFPVRNRLISALSDVVLVVEAPERSGSLITARYALLQGRTLFAVPGDVTSPRSVGSNLLLQAGARPALCAEDVLHPLLPRYHASLSLSEMQLAQQYSELRPEVFRRFGIRSAEEKERRRREREEFVRPHAVAPTVKETDKTDGRVAPDQSVLTQRQREIYRMMPAGRFTVDALVDRGVTVAEAVSALTVFEVHGLLDSIPGGWYEKK